MFSISIHASRGGSDLKLGNKSEFSQDISIHASRGGSDPVDYADNITVYVFQSTLPAGEATAAVVASLEAAMISIHASRGGSDTRQAANRVGGMISIHASRGGSDIHI